MYKWSKTHEKDILMKGKQPTKKFVMSFPANTRRRPNVVLMLGRRQRRRANSKTTLGQYLVFAGL